MCAQDVPCVRIFFQFYDVSSPFVVVVVFFFFPQGVFVYRGKKQRAFSFNGNHIAQCIGNQLVFISDQQRVCKYLAI